MGIRKSVKLDLDWPPNALVNAIGVALATLLKNVAIFNGEKETNNAQKEGFTFLRVETAVSVAFFWKRRE